MDNINRTLLSLILTLLSVTIYAQTNDPVVMNINGKDIKKSEFEYIYNKNNNEDAIDKRSLDEYITLFKNFKLRVAEAESQGMDTTAAFHKEFNEYRSQLAKSYLKDPEVDEQLLSQAYDRTLEYAEISAIFIAYPQAGKSRFFTVTPADTLAAYQKAMEVRNLAVKKNADFEALVKEYSFDERTKQSEHPGYMGWHSGLNLLPALEIPLSTAKAGQVTMPIRVPQGYYIIKVLNKKPHPGEVHAAHILIMSPSDADTVQITDVQNKVAEVYEKLKGGADFTELAKEYSEDKGTAEKGGDLSWIQFGQMVPEFNDVVFSMNEIGAVSQPFKTQFGYHIVKLLGKKPAASLDDLRSQIENKFDRTGNFAALHQPGIDKLKATHRFTLNEKVCKILAEKADTIFPADSLYTSQFEYSATTLFTINGLSVMVADFIHYLKNNPKVYSNLSSEAFTESLNQHIYLCLSEYESDGLESKYPEFKNLMQEYRDGILLFEISNQEVWEKASSDTEGLTKYFEENKSKYAWDEPHWKGYVVLVKDADTKKKLQKEIKKMTAEEAVQYLSDKYKTDETPVVKVEKGLFTKGQNKFVDETVFHAGKAEFPEAAYQDFFLLGKLLPKYPDSYMDVRGLVVTDYQDYLEQEWLKSLNEKYPVIIYKDIIEKEFK
jgi:peptidyl-prolyl cis-trans isomerase SurA